MFRWYFFGMHVWNTQEHTEKQEEIIDSLRWDYLSIGSLTWVGFQT